MKSTKEVEVIKDLKSFKTGIKHRDVLIDKFQNCLQKVGELDDDLNADDLQH